MATSSSGIQQLYEAVVADLVPYYMDSVLLPNPSLIVNSLSISGDSGNTVRFPLTNTYTAGADVAEGGSIVAAAASDFAPTSANITVQKRGVGTDVYEEALEDGGLALVQNAVLTRLSGGLALATDVAGFAEANASFTLADTGAGSANATTHSVSFVFSPEAMGFATKREPTVKMWFDPNTDTHQMRGTVRNGFTTLRGNFGNRITCNKTIGSGDANVVAIAKAVAQLRGENAPTMVNGMYAGVISPAFEYAIQEQIALAGGTTIGSLSDVGNRALLEGIVGQAAGAMLFRHTALPNA